MEERLEGKCLDMCPKSEILERQRHKRLAVFEMVAGTECSLMPKANRDACLKEYVRPAAGTRVDVSLLRPPHVLQRCMDYLISNVLAKEKHSRSWTEVYNFASDRMRAIRQDLVIQRTEEAVAVDILKKVVRFHILIMEELKREGTLNKASCIEQLHSSIFSFLEIAKKETKESLEIWIYYMLLNFNSKMLVDDSLRQILEFHGRIPYGILDVFDFIRENQTLFNYYKFFKFFEKLPYLSSCCLITSLSFLRESAFNVICKGYSAKNSKIPMSVVCDWLMFDTDEELKTFCSDNGICAKDGFVFTGKRNANGKTNTNIFEHATSWRLLGIKRTKSLKDYVEYGEENSN